jgi:eukaryotic-like serine/threonine-protein kinase
VYGIATRNLDDCVMPAQPPSQPYASTAPTLRRVVTQEPIEDDGLTQIGPYQVLRRLGVGASGAVYLARRGRFARPVAIKLFHDGSHASAIARQQIWRESLAQRAVQHPGILPLLDVGRHRGREYLVTPWAAGGDLAGRLNRLRSRHERMSPERALAIAETLARALHTAHTAGLVHCDVKPANVLFDRLGRPILSDFGVVAFSERGRRDGLIGTPQYMAPEQTLGRVDPRSDIYALGVMLCEMLSGHPPFHTESVHSTVAMQREAHPALSGAPVWTHAVLWRALAKDPDRRFHTALDFARALARIRQHAHGALVRQLIPPAIFACVIVTLLGLALSH